MPSVYLRLIIAFLLALTLFCYSLLCYPLTFPLLTLSSILPSPAYYSTLHLLPKSCTPSPLLAFPSGPIAAASSSGVAKGVRGICWLGGPMTNYDVYS